MGHPKDYFSAHAALYAARRPRYPQALFDWLAGVAPGRELAWDAGCGNGQASLGLATRFARVIATDPSAEQIAAALAHPGVEYRVEPAEAPSLAPASADLVCIAQALHWFDLDRFHPEVHRVLRPGGRIAACSYGLCRVDPAVDRVFMHLYEAVLGPWWPPERRHVENGYRDLAFPYRHLDAPPFILGQRWQLDHYLGYLRSWSATQRCLRDTGCDAVAELAAEFAAAWGDPQSERDVSFPLALRVGRVEG
ncbi:class I SAM-dependent methyltransferase [Pseudomarimonas salicorniae]|uniref:Class I SAM-dependent methyltransferase n=1 Tax=Pseudomarimonas salicorniae TaxID=2933270 RepID=A0ABT0GGA5_9GAMM|nr:class I SAM-dependent methyltransferase [Lysobacter sp. CAU 1642]MCK7593574.1 class I SAM-dependent methyltransferase [Lysobacter sp. CAU 1642]